jgi:glutathione S-transferase
MHELYWDMGTLAMAPHLALEEAGALYKLHRVDLGNDEQLRDGFRALNPACTVPVLTHEDLVLTESSAISLYVAEQHPEAGLLPPPGSRERAIALRWLMFAVNTLQPAGRRMFESERFSTDASHSDSIRARAEEDLLAGWRLIEDHALTQGPFVLGDRYSLADTYLVMFSTWCDEQSELFHQFPKLGRLFQAASVRPRTARVLEAHEVI